MATVTVVELEAHRTALTAHCARMLGTGGDADDAVQETLVRAWRSIDRFDGRSALGTWLQRIATNVCLDMLAERARRWRPIDPQHAPRGRTHWAEPVARAAEEPGAGDPSEQLAQQQSIRLAFVAALQHLPAKQRAVLLLAEVLGWSASEIAEAIEASVASVNSALQRARATLSGQDLLAATPEAALSEAQQRRLERYLAAFARDDANGFAGLLQEDAGFRLPSAEEAWAIRFRCWRGCLGSREPSEEPSKES
jgi:RNA polymerase sigma-70 factor (ECF subfamily)